MNLTYALPGDLEAQVSATIAEWGRLGSVGRLWARDASLWTSAGESDRLGWLDVAREQLEGGGGAARFERIARAARDERLAHVLLMGMGGSSLCPEVLARTFGHREGFPRLLVLDSTDPAQVSAFERQLDAARTAFIVSSKSGTTLEPDIFLRYFFERARERLGADAGRRFIAITDPGTPLEQQAERDGFQHVFYGVPTIGGRFSALSDFGMVPAAMLGIDVRRLLERADAMARACGPDVPAADNPGVVLGALLGVAGRRGRDKVTLATSPGLAGLGAWLEQLIAESTGKRGVALIPVVGERLAEPDAYGDDRLFVQLRLGGDGEGELDAALTHLERAGQPVVRIDVADHYALGQEFFRWEFATAVAGAILGVNPFDQPDVEAAKLAARRLTSEYERTGALPGETPILEGGGIRLYADARNAQALAAGAEAGAGSGARARAVAGAGAAAERSVVAYLRAHLNRLGRGDYFALLAFLEMAERHDAELQAIRHRVRDARRVATCLGYGPRFLHSTGQAYKGGPNTGVFLQITCDDAADLPVPGRAYTFGVVKAAQARGDLEVLGERGRRALRVHLGADVAAGLRTLRGLVERALG
jgi:transaldolase/glucose-6-phosphate isomerase